MGRGSPAGVRVPRPHLSQCRENRQSSRSIASGAQPFLHGGLRGFSCVRVLSSGKQVPDGEAPEARIPLFRMRPTR